MKYIKWQNRKLAYQVEGRGRVVVLLHGFCSDSFIWNDFKQDLIEENYKVVSIDLPGFGESDLLEDASIDEMANAVHAILQEIQLKEFILIGHSMGGYVSLSYAERYPEKLAGLGLFHSHPYADSEEKKAARLKGINFIQRHGHQLYVKQLIPKLFTEKVIRSNPFQIDKLVFRASRYSAQGIIDALNAMRNRPDRARVLSNIQVPVLFLIGEEDGTIPKKWSFEQTTLPQRASIQLLKKVAHMGMFEAEKQTQIIIRKFADFCFQK